MVAKPSLVCFRLAGQRKLIGNYADTLTYSSTVEYTHIHRAMVIMQLHKSFRRLLLQTEICGVTRSHCIFTVQGLS